MFSGEMYYMYYRPLNSSEKVDKIVGITSFFFAQSKFVGFNRYFYF